MAPQLSDLTAHYPILCSLASNLEIHELYNLARTCDASWVDICYPEGNFDNLITKTACTGRGSRWGKDKERLLATTSTRKSARLASTPSAISLDARAFYSVAPNTYDPRFANAAYMIQYRCIHDTWYCQACYEKLPFGTIMCNCDFDENWWYEMRHSEARAQCYPCARRAMAERVDAAYEFWKANRGARKWLREGSDLKHCLVRSCDDCGIGVGEANFVVVCPQCLRRARRHRLSPRPANAWDWYAFPLGGKESPAKIQRRLLIQRARETAVKMLRSAKTSVAGVLKGFGKGWSGV